MEEPCARCSTLDELAEHLKFYLPIFNSATDLKQIVWEIDAEYNKPKYQILFAIAMMVILILASV